MSSQIALQQYIESSTQALKDFQANLTDPVSWVCYEVVLHRKKGDTNSWLKGGTNVLDCPEFNVAKIATAFANEQRVRLLKAIYQGHHTFSGLKEQTDMNAGQLQHHLRELALSSFLLETSKRNHYELSKRGKALLLLMLCIGKWEPDTEGTEHYLTPEQVEVESV